jgi:hypothetical protein
MKISRNFLSITTTLIRWTARILSVISIAILALFLFGESGFTQSITEKPLEWIGLFFFPFGVAAGMILSWFKDSLGAAVTAASLLIFYFINYFGWGSFPSGPWFLLFSSPGFLFGLSWVLDPEQSPLFGREGEQ